MDKAVHETPPLECHLDIQWEWKGNLGKIGEQTHWFGRPIVQQMWPWRNSTKEMAKNWYV